MSCFKYSIIHKSTHTCVLTPVSFPFILSTCLQVMSFSPPHPGQQQVKHVHTSLQHVYHSPPLCGTEPGPNSRQALSHQLKKRGSQDVRDISKTETVSCHDSLDNSWCLRDKSWTKDSVVDVFEVLSISEPCCDGSQSQQTF